MAELNSRLPQTGPAAYELLGRSNSRADRLDQAVPAFEAGLKAHPNSIPLPREAMVRQFLGKGRPDRERSDKILSELEKLPPNDSVLLRIRAAALQRARKPNRQTASEVLSGAVRPASSVSHIYT